MQIIRDLDRQLGTDNYLPIFHLRQKFQPPLSREQLDQLLYRLQRNDRIDLSSLQEVSAYTPEQIDAGIPQDIGGPLSPKAYKSASGRQYPRLTKIR